MTAVDPRPAYRVIAEPWYDHDVGADGHDALACAAGYTLEVWIINPDQLGLLGTWRQLGVTQTESGGTLDTREVMRTVINYVQVLAYPHLSNPDPDRIEIYARVDR